MGKYINIDSKGKIIGTTYLDKINGLINDGAEKIQEPKEWKEGLVCVINNGFFAAAGYAYNQEEMEMFAEKDGRPKTWLYKEDAKQLAK